MSKLRVGLVTAWGECGMGYIARNWVHTFEKHLGKLQYQIFSRANPFLTPFRWHGPNVVDGPETMSIDNEPFWNWIDSFHPDVLLLQDQNIYGPTKMRKESERLRKTGIRLINYPDWIKRGDIEQYRGLYDVNLSHVRRNHRWLIDGKVESPTYIPWGVITKNFPFIERRPDGPVRFYINIGTGTRRKGYPCLPRVLERMKGPWPLRFIKPRHYDYRFIATAIENSRHRVKKKFVEYFERHSPCELIFKTADNSEGGLFSLGDVYIYPTIKEGVGLTITEAMCTGMPVVTTDYPTMNEWLTDGVEGRLIRTAKVKRGSMPTDKAYIDISHLARIMVDYIDNPEQIVEQSHNSHRKILKEFNWDDRDSQILKLLGL